MLKVLKEIKNVTDVSIVTLANELSCIVSPDGGGIGDKTGPLLETILYKIMYKTRCIEHKNT